MPTTALFAVPNGGRRGVVEAANFKAEGVRSGVPDLFLCVPRGVKHGLFIEMKSLIGKPGAGQKEFIEFARTQNFAADFAYGADAAIQMIIDYLGEP